MTPLRNILIYVLSLAVLATGGLAVRDSRTLLSPVAGTSAAVVQQGSVLRPFCPPLPGVDRLRIVIIGADSRKGDKGRSDTLMLLQVNPTLHRATMLSLPRDLRVPIPGHGENKINAAFAEGGAELTKQTVEQLLGITADGYAEINMDGFVKAVDTLGGVNLDVEDVEGKGRGMNYDCPGDGLVIHLFPGYQHLTGYKAMGYVRYRHSNIRGAGGTDFQRAARQQKLLKALLVQKVKVTNLPALMKAGQQIFSCLDTSLSWRETFDLMRLMREMQPGDMKSMVYIGGDWMLHGVYYCRLDPPKLHDMMSEADDFLNGAVTSGPVLVEVLNGYMKTGAAATAAEKLKKAGFQVVRVGNATTRNYLQTKVLYRGMMEDPANQVAQALGAGTVEHDPSGPAPEGTAQIQVTIGKDFGAAAAKKPAKHPGKKHPKH